MRTFKKTLTWLVVIIIVVVVGGFFAASYFINSFKPELEQKLTKTIGFETKIDGPISLKVLPGVSFVINDLKVINNETYLVRAAKIEIAIDYTQIFNPQIDIKALHFIKPQLYVARNGDGTFNFDIPMAAIQAPASQSKSKYKINLSELTISEGRVLYLDHEFGDTLSAEGINLFSDNIALSGTIGNLDIKRLNFSGKLGINKLKLNSLLLDSLNLIVAGREGKLSIEEKSKPFFGGNVNGKILIDFNQKPVLIHNQHTVTGMHIGEFLRAAHSKPYLSGIADYTFEMTFHSFSWQKAMESLTGSFSLSAQNLIMKGMDIDKVLTSFDDTQDLNTIDLTAVFMMGPFGAVFSKGMNFTQLLKGDSTDVTQINTLVSDWTIKNGKAQTKDVAFSTNKYRIAAQGGLDFTTDQFDNLTIAVIYRNGCAGISQTLNGIFVDYQSESISTIGKRFGTAENLSIILSNPIRSNCEPFYFGSVEHPR